MKGLKRLETQEKRCSENLSQSDERKATPQNRIDFLAKRRKGLKGGPLLVDGREKKKRRKLK